MTKQYFHTLLAVIAALIGSGSRECVCQDASSGGESIVRAMLDARSEIEDGEVEIEIKVVDYRKPGRQILVGSTNAIHMWLDGDEMVRVDWNEDRPADPKNQVEDRFVKRGDDYLIIRGHGVAGQELLSPKEDPREKSSDVVFTNYFDPRLIGCIATSFATLKNYDLETLEGRLLDGEDASGAWESSRDDGNVTAVLEKNGVRISYIFAQEHPGCPIEISTTFTMAGDKCRDSLVVVPASVDGPGQSKVSYPASATYKRFLNEELFQHEEWIVKNAQFRRPPTDDVFTWAALKPDIGYVVFRGEKGDTSNGVQWNGESFEKWQPKPLSSLRRQPVDHASGSTRKVLVAANLFAVVLIGAIWYFSRRRR